MCEKHDETVKLLRTLFPEAVIRCFIACSFTSFPSFIQATVAGGAFSVASNDAAAPRATVNELGKAVKIGAWTCKWGGL